MKHLISTDKPVILLPPVIPPVIIFSPPEMDPPVTDKPKPPPHPEALPETPDPVFTFPESGEGIPLPVLPGPVVTVETGISDGAPMATLTITPEYPRIAVDRNLDGYVIVEFDISETGRVINPRVIESHPGTLFNRSALKAISRFRYKPMVVDGQPVEFYGAFYRFIYELDK
ncbi:MAG: TonB family protein [Gammaproteobacteria bacterium]|nr:TonB family protein [Gammaproteobacteria bacterium]